MLLKLVRQFAPRHASERRTHTPNRSCYICTAHLAQVLIATSFRAASSQPTVTPLSLSTCRGAYRKFLEMSSSCGDNDDDARGKCRTTLGDICPPRTGTTCASDACVGFIASVTDAVVQDMSTGLASCTGEDAWLQADADEARLTYAVRSTASECELTSVLTPPPLNTCEGANSKVRELFSSCGKDDDDDHHHTLRTDATCASDACVSFMSNMTDEALQEMTTGIASCPAEDVSLSTVMLTWVVRKAASDCGLATALTPQPLSTCVGAYLKTGELFSSCGDDDDDNDDDDHTPRTDATCASEACVSFISSVTDEALQDMTTGVASCPAEMGMPDVTSHFLRTSVLKAASDCNLATALTITCGSSWGNYALADSGAADCTGCGEPIASYNACVIAALSGAAVLGIGPLSGTESSGAPAGCHIREGFNFRFNSNMDATSASVGHTPVCVVPSSPLPPQQPSPSPPPPIHPSPPVLPPSPLLPGTLVLEAVVFEISVTAAGTVETFDKAGFKTKMRSYLGCNAPLCQVAITVTAGSVNVVATVTDTTSTAVAAAAKLTTDVVDVRELSAALGVTVEAAPTVSATTKTTLTVRPAAPSVAQQPDSNPQEESAAVVGKSGDELSVGAIAGIAVGGLVVGVYCFFAARRSRRRSAYLKKQRLENTTATSAGAGRQADTRPSAAGGDRHVVALADVVLTRPPRAVQSRLAQSAAPETAAVPGVAVKKQGIDYV